MILEIDPMIGLGNTRLTKFRLFSELFELDKFGSGCLRPGHSVGNMGPIHGEKEWFFRRFRRKCFPDSSLGT
jgi:hypothetical protein